jgi:hypothetical protein
LNVGEVAELEVVLLETLRQVEVELVAHIHAEQ